LKKIIRLFPLFFFLAFSFCVVAQNIKIPTRPDPPKLVNDFAKILPDDQERALENELADYARRTSTQIVVLTLDSLDDQSPVEITYEVIRKWGIGQKGKNNGVLILVGLKDRKTFIGTGAGIDGVLPDMICRRIVDEYLIPNFKQGKYAEGLAMAAQAIEKRAAGEYKNENYGKHKGGDPFWTIVIILVVLFIIITLISNNRRGGGYYNSRGVFPGGGGPFIFGGGGGSGSSWGGGGGDSGDSGFGGFGGGDSGGGGAGGDW
jgi:uncharacterized protein